MYSKLFHKISQTLEEVLGWEEKYKNLIFVSGFPRSGTTFVFEVIAKLTGYRTVFEPMHYNVPKSGVFNEYGKKFVENKKEKWQYFPYFDKNKPKLKERHFFERTIRGEVLHPRVDRYRSIGDFAKRGTVVKCVRSNLLFDWFCQSFGARGVLIVRHPCAVLDSIRRQTWGWWLLKKKFLRLFLSQNSLSKRYLDSRSSLVAKCRDDPVRRLALGMCLCTEVPLIQCKEQAELITIEYENLVLNPNDVIEPLLQNIDLEEYSGVRSLELDEPSSSTQESRKSINAMERCFGWKENLEDESIQKVKEVVSIFQETKKLVNSIEKKD